MVVAQDLTHVAKSRGKKMNKTVDISVSNGCTQWKNCIS